MSCPRTDALLELEAGLLSKVETAELEQHLTTCQPCREAHRRLATIAVALAPDAHDHPAFVRSTLAALDTPKAPPRWRAALTATTIALALAMVLVVVDAKTDDGFAARGNATHTGQWAGINVFVNSPRGYLPAGAQILVSDALAFSYTNRASSERRYLMILAIDAGWNVYWFYPGWVDASQDPSSIAITRADEPMRLPEDVRHDLKPGPLKVLGLFSEAPLSVSEVERAVGELRASGASLQGLQKLAVPNTSQHVISLDVQTSVAPSP